MGVPRDLKSYSLSLLSHVHKDQFALCLYDAVKCACVGSLSEEDEESPASWFVLFKPVISCSCAYTQACLCSWGVSRCVSK